MNIPRLTPELYCTDFPLTLEFYTSVLGFTVAYDRPEEKFAMLSYQGAEIMIEQIGTNVRKWLAGPLEKPFGRGVSFQIETDEVDALYNRVKKASLNPFLDMEEKWYRADKVEVGNRQFIVQDPDGFLLRFFQDIGERPPAP